MELWKKWLNLALVAVLTLSLLTPAATAENGANETFSDNETSGTEPSEITEGTTSDTADIEFDTATDEAVLAVIELINALPAIEEASETNELLIQEARTAYEALTEEQKLNVTNIDLLVEKENILASLKDNLESSLLSLNHLGEPKGYAYFSIEDFAIREDGAEFAEPLGVIIERTMVPFYEGDTIADVTVRTLEGNGITPGYGGDTKNSFYLSSIQNFTHNGEYIQSFGEFSAGFMSGWMISLNDWFINMGASEFLVTEGDTISWQYTSQMGADIGSDWTNQSAQITGLKIGENFGELSPTFDPQVKQYTLIAPPNTQFVQVAAEANKQSRVRYYVGETEYKYLNNIPAEDGTVIKISSIFEDTYSGANDSDEIFITIQDESKDKINAVVELINALPTITLADEATQLQLQQARAAYHALTEEQKQLVSNIDELINKENYFTALKHAQELDQQIANLPTVEKLQWTNKNEVEQVANLYAALTEEVQALITNYDKLEALQKRLIELQPTALTTEQAYNTVGNYITSIVTNPKFGNEWFILTLARGNYSVPTNYYETYYNNVVEHVKSVNGNLHERKYTEYSRLILALTAIGKDPTNIGGYNLVEKLADFDNVVWQGVNGAYYGLIALDTWGFELPETATTTREKLIDFILSKQLPDGGFALSGTKADPDMTAMAIQSLAPYYNQGNVKTAIDTAVNTLATIQSANGGYGSWGVENVESAIQVIAALVSLGIDPAKDTRFNKVIPNILTYYSETDGGFKHVLSEKKANGMATEQVGYTLAAYNRLLNGQSSLYNMVDTKPIVPEHPNSGETEQPNLGETVQPNLVENEQTNIDETEQPNLGENEQTNTDETEQPNLVENEQTNPGETVQPKPEQAYGYSTFSIVISSSEVPLAPITTEIFAGETVFDVLKRVAAENDVSLSYRDSTYGIYIEGINGLYEFDKGPESGWMYRVNGVFPSYSAALHVLQPGDRVEWLYTTNLGKDVGGYIEDIEKEPGQTEKNSTKDKEQAKDKETQLEQEKEDNKNQETNKKQENNKTIIEVDSKEGTTETTFTSEDIQQYTQNNVTTIAVQEAQGTNLEIPTSTLSSIHLAANEKIVTAVTVQAEGKQIDVNLSIETADGTTKAISTGKAYAKITLPATNVTANTVVLQSVNGEYKAVPHKIVDGEIIILTKSSGTFVVMEETVTFKDITEIFNKEEIEFLASRHIIKGVNADEFAPNKPITRAQFAVMISRALGLQASEENPFNDTKGQWYEQEIQALFEAGITTGKAADTFDPEANITRQQAAALMARVLAYVNFQAQSSTEANFNDANAISTEFKQSINLLNSLNIMTGKADGTFDPYSSLTRAQMAKILKRTLNVADLM